MNTIFKTRNALFGLMAGLLLLATALTIAPSARADLFAANYSGNNIVKFDAATGAFLGVFTTTSLNGPTGIAFDSAGNLYVPNFNINTIRKVTPAGVSTLFASTGLSRPYAVAFDSAGNLFVVNNGAGSANNTIMKFTPSGVGSTFATTSFGAPYGLAFDSAGNLYVSENGNVIEKFTPGGVGSVFANTLLNHPVGLAVDGAGNLYAANYLSNSITKFTQAGVGSLFANTGLNLPTALAVDSAGNVYAANQDGGTIRKFTPGGLGSVFANSGLNLPYGLAFTRSNTPPIANAGVDFSVNEGQTGVALNGSLSSDPDNDPLTYAWVQLPGGPAVTLTGANTASPTFTAPTVALGGETLSFDLTVTANGETSTDTVSVTVVNVNHPPVAEAGLDQSIAEGSPVTLHGEDSFDIDTDPFTHAWVQVSGSPTVTLTGADTANPTFTAPTVGTNGAPGVVATLVFELRVDDGFLPAATDAPAPGYALTNVVDRVTVEITNVNNDPVAAAGADQTVNENSAVALSGATSSDPDSDTLTYAWAQVGTPTVTLTGAATATPSFTAPFVSAGGADLEFEVTVDDGYGGSATDTVVIHVQNINDPPLASAAQPTVGVLWPPNHQMVAVGITGVTDPNNNATIIITGVTQDEPTNGLGDGDTAIDAVINSDGTVLLRSERAGNGNGRVYRISFTASDLEGSTSGVVKVSVPHSVKKTAVDSSGVLYNSTN